jgi:hypothetical protein
MDHKKGLILGCVLGASSQPFTDLSRWHLPILLRYCPAKEPRADRFERSEEMVRLEAAGFFPLALVATNLDGQAGLGLVIGDETPATVRQHLLQQEQKILDEAREHEDLRGAASAIG